MNQGKAKALDLFLLMLNLSQLSKKETIIQVFVGALCEIWPKVRFFHQPFEDSGSRFSLEIENSGSHFGFIALDRLEDLSSESQALLQNAVSMLGVILKKNELDGTLAREKSSLSEQVEKNSDLARTSEEKFRTVFENSVIGMSLTTLDGQLQTNAAFRHILGYSEAEMSALNWREITHPDDIAKNDEILASILAGERNSARWEKRYASKGGSTVWVDISTSLQRDARGEPLFFITSINDITGRKRTEEMLGRRTRQDAEDLERRVRERTQQLQAVNSELEAFSYSISHDLRAPLRAISGFSRILVDDHSASLDAEGRRLCSVIVDNATRMSRLIDDLLAFSRIGRAEIQAVRVDMGALAASTVAELTAAEDASRIECRVGALPAAVGDPALLRQVWVNLISNAIKFSSKKQRAQIAIDARQGENEVIYCVRDNGAGFDMSYSDKLFGVFQRLHSTHEFDGTGVGLAIVQRIINRHNGHAWAEAKPDEGASFFFSLPSAG